MLDVQPRVYTIKRTAAQVAPPCGDPRGLRTRKTLYRTPHSTFQSVGKFARSNCVGVRDQTGLTAEAVRHWT